VTARLAIVGAEAGRLMTSLRVIVGAEAGGS
jgi:hypothetical protein